MNLRSLDLNLLLVFDAIYAERSVSKAAVRLRLSQPAVSNALARLRERLADRLFTRTSDAMVPTLRAQTLAEPVRRALDLIEQGLRERESFDYTQSDRRFVLAADDYGEAVILPRFVDRLARVAPRLRIQIRPEPASELRDAMQAGQVDMAIHYVPQRGPSFHNARLLVDRLLTLARTDHPQIGEKLSLEQYLALHHVALLPRGRAMPMIDMVLTQRGMQRHVSVEVSHFMAMPIIAQATELLCTLPRRIALLAADPVRLRTHALPLRVPDFPIYLTWHRDSDDDAPHEWFRRQLVEFCQRL